MHAGARGARRLVLRVEHDCRRGLRGSMQLVVRLVVAVEEDALGRDAGRPREGELAEGRHIGADAFVREHAQQLDVRECLRPVHDQRVRGHLAVGTGPGTNRLLAVDEERRPVGGREGARGDAAEAELARFDPGR